VPHIEAFVSIDYRLSPYPLHPKDPSSEDDLSRNAVHPDHLNDVKSALAYIHDKWAPKEYILVGHSVGATLAFQSVALKDSDSEAVEKSKAVEGSQESELSDSATQESTLPEPRAILAIAGLYELDILRNSDNEPVEFVTSGFGKDADLKKVSPTNLDYSLWRRADRAVVLVHSTEDEMVDKSQALAMRNALVEQKVFGKCLETRGKHDLIWAKGGTLPSLIAETVEFILEQDNKVPEENGEEAATVDLSGYDGFEHWKPEVTKEEAEKPAEAQTPVRLPILKRFLSFLSPRPSNGSTSK
jgi:kynurenine formamidase